MTDDRKAASAAPRSVSPREPTRKCSVCTAVVATYPEGMCCHCQELPWPVDHDAAPLPDVRAVTIEECAQVLLTKLEIQFGPPEGVSIRERTAQHAAELVRALSTATGQGVE